MLEKKSAGDNIASVCTKCRLTLDHIIVAMDGETIAKVKCRTCGSTHRFRKPGSPLPEKRVRVATKKESSTRTAEILWETCLAEAKGKQRTYEMAGKYRVGDIVEHQVFGKGVVRKIYINKCNVLFRDKERLMASGNS